MSACTNAPLSVGQGTTFTRVYRWSAPPLIYKPVTAVPSLTPLTLTVTAHGVPNGWPVALTALGGLAALNASNWPPAPSDYLTATVVDTNTLAFTDVDASRVGTYTSGGTIAYLTPVPLTGVTGTLTILQPQGPPFTLTPPFPPALPTPILTIAAVVTPAAQTISIMLTAAQTQALASGQYTYTLEVTDSTGAVTLLDQGQLLIFTPGVTGIPGL
ncbi:hypothetical protein [Dokdonella soli]|uniref:MBG domain-containing protein n=1 Tax=Dokdonella soli TaxID=529810 RepID=A0ABN1IUA5_9GAMM